MTILGSDFIKKILTAGPGGKPLDTDRYERALVEAIDAGGLAPFVTRYVPLTISKSLGGVAHELTIGVAPNFAAIGTDADYFLFPATPWTYQYLADKVGAILPSRKLTRDVFNAARLSGIAIEPHPFLTNGPDGKPDGGRYNESVARFVESDAFVHNQLAKVKGFSVDALQAGAKKDVVVAPDLDGSAVKIFGWYRLTDLGPWQNGFGPHEGTYKDYSHGGRMIARTALLDGKKVDLVDVFQDPTLYKLVADDAEPYRPHFPNAGKLSAPVGYFPDASAPPSAFIDPGPPPPSQKVPVRTPKSPAIVKASAPTGAASLALGFGLSWLIASLVFERRAT